MRSKLGGVEKSKTIPQSATLTALYTREPLKGSANMKVEMTENEYIVLKEFIDINKLDIEILSVVVNTRQGDGFAVLA